MNVRRRLLLFALVAVMTLGMFIATYATTYVSQMVKYTSLSFYVKEMVDYHDGWWCLESVEYTATVSDLDDEYIILKQKGLKRRG